MEHGIIREFVESVRKRPAMYIGTTSERGFRDIVSGLINYTFNSLSAEYCSFEILGGLSVRFMAKDLKEAISDNIPVIFNTADDGSFPSFEFLVLNAVCKSFSLRINDRAGNELVSQTYERGLLKDGKIENRTFDAAEFEVTFELDDSIFDISSPLNPNRYHELIRDLAYLYKKRTLSLSHSVGDEVSKPVFRFENGLADRIDVERSKGLGATLFDSYLERQFEGFSVEAAYGFREYPVDPSYLVSYVNYIHTFDEGVHVDGSLKGLTSALLKHSYDVGISLTSGISIESVRRRLLAAVHVKMSKPHFEGSVRYKLISRGVGGQLANLIGDMMLKQLKKKPRIAEDLIRQLNRGR